MTMAGGPSGPLQGPVGWNLMRSMARDRSARSRRLSPGLYRRIWRFAAPWRWRIAAFVGLILLDSLTSAANPLIYRAIIDDGALAHRPDVVVMLALVLAALAVLDAAISIAARWLSASIGEGLIYDLRRVVFAHIQRMPIAFFSRTQTGALVSRVNNDVLDAQQAFTGTLSSVVGNVLGVAFTLVAMLWLSWQITLVALIALPLIILPGRWVGRRIEAITRESHDLNGRMMNTMSERFNVAGALLVKLFGEPDRELANFEAKAGRVRDIGVIRAMYSRVVFAAIVLAAALATALVYGWGGVLAANAALPVGTLVALAAYLNRLYAPLTALSNVQVDVMSALVSFDRLFEVLGLQPGVAEQPGAAEIPAGPATVELDHVAFRYPRAEEVSLASLESVAALDQAPSAQILFDVTFTARPGQLVALVGPSGAGKTTISALIPRLYDPQAGAVRINGVDLREATLESVRRTVGVVTQDAHLFHETIRENLLYARAAATEDELWVALAAAQIAPLVRSLPDGLDTVVGDRGYRLSGGEKQRIAIARLLLKAPDVVVLDEATAHLDSESEAAVQQALRTALSGRTSIVIAHRLSTIREADQVLVIAEGRVVQRGTHSELLARGGLYADLYRTQFQEHASDGTAATRAAEAGTARPPTEAGAAEAWETEAPAANVAPAEAAAAD